MKKILLVILICLANQVIFAQLVKFDSSYINYGLFSNFNLNSHYSNFFKLKPYPNCCPKDLGFQSGSGSGFSAGLIYEYFIDNKLGISFLAGYSDLSGDLKQTEPIKLSSNGVAIDGEFEHVIKSYISVLDLNIRADWTFSDKLKIKAGIGTAYLIFNKFDQYERISKPEGEFTFIDSSGSDTQSDIRNSFTGLTIPNINKFQFYLTAGIDYEFPLNSSKSLLLVPEISFNYALTNINSEVNKWKINTIKAGIAVLFSNAKYRNLTSERLIRESDSLRCVQDSLNKISFENERKISLLNKTKAEDSLKTVKEKMRLDSLNNRFEMEKKAELETILEANKESGKICNFYSVLYSYSLSEVEADNLIKELQKEGCTNLRKVLYEGITISDGNIKNKSYRVLSKQYSTYNEASEEKKRIVNAFEKLKIEFKNYPSINCE